MLKHEGKHHQEGQKQGMLRLFLVFYLVFLPSKLKYNQLTTRSKNHNVHIATYNGIRWEGFLGNINTCWAVIGALGSVVLACGCSWARLAVLLLRV